MALSDSTKRMISLLPSWTEIYKNPESDGAKLIDIPGEEVTSLGTLIVTLLNNTSVSTADPTQIDIIYRSEYFDAIDDTTLTVKAYIGSTEINATDAKTLYNFYQLQDIDHPRYIYDAEDNSIYMRFKYDYLVISGTIVYDQRIHHVWNSFDEVGLLIGCPRLYGENNASYSSRMQRAIALGKGTTKDLVSGNVAIDLGLDSIEVKSMTDAAFINTMLNDKGEPTQKLLDYISVISNNMDQYWDNAVWDKTLWDTIEKDKTGLSYIPHVWSIPEDYAASLFKSGIGDGDDLLISIPNDEDLSNQVNYAVGIKGITKVTENIYPTRSFRYKLYATGTTSEASAVPEDYWYTVIASPKIPIEADIVASGTYVQSKEFPIGAVIDIDNYALLTDADKPTTMFVDGSAMIVVNADTVQQPHTRYIKIKATLTSDGQGSKYVESITLNYTTASGAKTLIIDKRDSILVDGDTTHIGFEMNNLGSADAILCAGQLSNIEWDTTFEAYRLPAAQYKMTMDHDRYANNGDRTNIIVSSTGGIFLNI